MSMTLMLSSTGLGSWAHTNLHRARASPLSSHWLPCTLTHAGAPSLGADVQKPGGLPVPTPGSNPDSALALGPLVLYLGDAPWVIPRQSWSCICEVLLSGTRRCANLSLCLQGAQSDGERARAWAITIWVARDQYLEGGQVKASGNPR